MANPNSSRDKNFVPTLSAVSSVDGDSVVTLYADPTTHRLLVDLAAIATLLQKDTFTSTNGQTTFTPTKTVAFDLYISVNGAIQTPSTNYSIVGGSYVLNSGIPAGCDVVLLYATA